LGGGSGGAGGGETGGAGEGRARAWADEERRSVMWQGERCSVLPRYFP